jgi:hypothetical protein
MGRLRSAVAGSADRSASARDCPTYSGGGDEASSVRTRCGRHDARGAGRRGDRRTAAPSAGDLIPRLYKNCTNLNKKYPHGVGRRLARTRPLAHQ